MFGLFGKGKGKFSDQEVIDILRTLDHPQTAKVLDFLYVERLAILLDIPYYKNVLPQIEERINAYSDAFQILISRIRSKEYQISANIKTYFERIFKGKCIDLFRSKKFDKRKINQHIISDSESILQSFQQSTIDLLEDLIHKDLYEKLQNYLDHLGEPCKTIINRTTEGYKAKEVGELLGMSANYLGVKKRECIEMLIQLKNKDIGPDNE